MYGIAPADVEAEMLDILRGLVEGKNRSVEEAEEDLAGTS